ncbi:hypothetical protein RJ639_035498 [Escallonia herrerae]|uniref:Retrotransposon gag domain-containing protein n=1 Tax=Escallonia herrerae TaxID=1293975 RepID=A0AA88X6M9_9ASTE|nr:hypothetical protein RJ639_035498 [Escallonia herrerae]
MGMETRSQAKAKTQASLQEASSLWENSLFDTNASRKTHASTPSGVKDDVLNVVHTVLSHPAMSKESASSPMVPSLYKDNEEDDLSGEYVPTFPAKSLKFKTTSSQSISSKATFSGKEDAETNNAHKGKNKEVSEGETSNVNEGKNKEVPEGEDSNKKTMKEFIMGTIKDKFEGPTKSSLTYAKLYTLKIDLLRMSTSYQLPKFQQFNSKCNPKQHIAQFVETCNNAGTYEDHLVKQFARSLKGNAFDWYINLQPHSINSWEQLEQEFIDRFYSTCLVVSMIELTNSPQRKDEPVIDYFNRSTNLSLNYKDRLSESSTIEMCIQGMQWGLYYILQGM